LSGDDNAALQKLLSRVAKSYLYFGQVDNAASSLEKLDKSPEVSEMIIILTRLQNDSAASVSSQNARGKMISTLPRTEEVL